jgi:membrane-associated protease RseP (regulator of RpoE activity)
MDTEDRPPPVPKWCRARSGDADVTHTPIPGPVYWGYARVPWQAPTVSGPLHSRRHLVLAGLLFALTVVSTTVTWGGAYSATMMTILLCHEMGHYLMCRRYHVRCTLPLFIPMPIISPFGTMGAVIFMRQGIRDRKTLFDIGIAGPLAGLVPALAAVAWGLAHSSVVTVLPDHFAGLRLGDSLLFALVQKILYPGLGAQQELMLHPVAYAGWAGLFVTALNLLPIGQLDGGHVVNGLLGHRNIYVSWAFLAALAVLAIFHPQWWVLVGLLLLLLTRRPPMFPPESIPLDRRRVVLGIFALTMFALSFTPQPFVTP